jgi:hypothetical protein
MDPLDERAWRDWQRVEACIQFGVVRYICTGVALWYVEQHLRPISEWLSVLASFGILAIHFAVVKRIDARRLKEG